MPFYGGALDGVAGARCGAGEGVAALNRHLFSGAAAVADQKGRRMALILAQRGTSS